MIDFLIAGFIATLIMGSREAREERQRNAQIDAYLANEERREREKNEYLHSLGFNRERQDWLHMLGRSTLLEERRQFAEILGRPCYNSEPSVERAIRAIADKEGWRYYNDSDLYSDPEYCRIVGALEPSKQEIENYEHSEKERRAQEQIWQQWAKRHPKCMKADVTPELYDTEDQFKYGVVMEYYKWRRKCFDSLGGIKATDYETEEEYNQAVKEKRAELAPFLAAIEREGGKKLTMSPLLSYYYDSIKKAFATKPGTIPAAIFIYLIFINKCMHGGSDDDRVCTEILRIFAERDGYDLNTILDSADKNELLPADAIIYRSYYLGYYLITEDRQVWSIRSSDECRSEYGFTLEDFGKHCPDNPDYFYTPPKRGAAGISRSSKTTT